MSNIGAIWQELLIVLGGNATLLVVLGFLFKSLLSQALTRDIEKYKTELKAEADVSIERLKSSLQMTALEHQVQFSKLHEKRAEVVAEIYKQLVALEREGKRLIIRQGIFRKGSGTSEEVDAAEKMLYDLFSFVNVHKIYLPPQVDGLMDDFYQTLREPFAHASTFGDIQSDDPNILQQRRDGFIQANRAFQKEVPAARKALEQEFRLLLGGKT
jgi:hypothetical protein